MWLLLSTIGIHIAEMGFADTGVRHFVKAIEWLRSNFNQPMKVSELARLPLFLFFTSILGCYLGKWMQSQRGTHG